LVNWHRFIPADFEYDFEGDELAAQHVTFDEKKLSDQEIDQIVIAQADDDSAWEEPVRVRRTKSASLYIPVDLAHVRLF
jgi:hypothetical protein